MDAYLRTLEDRRWYANREYELRPLRPQFAGLRPEQITPPIVQLWIRGRRGAGIKDSTIDRNLRALRRVLSWGVQHQWIDRAPYVETPGGNKPRERWLSREEAQKVIDGCVEHHVRLFVILALHTAARTRAILDLTWDRVDLERRLVMYPPAHERSRKRTAIVPMTRLLHAELTLAREAATCDHVIEYRGKPIQSVKRGFQAALRRAGVAHATRHDLRRTAATWMVMDGVPVEKVAKFLGDTVEVVERHYAQFQPNYLAEAASALEGKA